jgi:hypothetical protein
MSQSYGPYQSPQTPGTSYGYPTLPPRSGAVTAAAVLNFVFGALHVLCGGLLGMVVAVLNSGDEQFIEDFKEGFGGEPPPNMTWEEMFEIVTIAIGVFVVIALITAVLAIIAGVGVIKRRNWGRVLALIIAVVSLLIGILAIVGSVQQGDASGWLGVIFYVGYGIIMFVLLLSSGASADFNAAAYGPSGNPYAANPYGGQPPPYGR